LANGMKMWKGNGNTTTLLYSLKRLEIVHQERRGQVKTIVMEHFNCILFHKSGPVNKQHTNQPTFNTTFVKEYICGRKPDFHFNYDLIIMKTFPYQYAIGIPHRNHFADTPSSLLYADPLLMFLTLARKSPDVET
jgi:hypothetical protein